MAPSQVVTAGGAGKQKRRKNKRTTPRSIAAATAAEEEKEIVPDDQNGSSPPATSRTTATDSSTPASLEFESSTTNLGPLSDETPNRKEKHLQSLDSLYKVPSEPVALEPEDNSNFQRNLWLFSCFFGIMISFVAYGLLLEYATSGGRKLHELSFLFVTSGVYTLTAAAGRHVRDETPTSIPPARFAILGLTSMGSTFCSVRSLRYVIYPIQVLAKSCKPVPVMLMGALMGKKYPFRKYINVAMIVAGVALFMGGGNSKKKDADSLDTSSQLIGMALLFVSLCFDGGTGAYEDKLMAVHSVGPFDLMYNIQLGKTILAGVGLVILNQVHEFLQMCQDMGFLLVALGLAGAMGQVFIFVTIAKFGALTCSIIGLARKITTLVASILFFGHSLAPLQLLGLVIAVGAMVLNFWGKKNKKKSKSAPEEQEIQKLLDEEKEEGDLELQDLQAVVEGGAMDKSQQTI